MKVSLSVLYRIIKVLYIYLCLAIQYLNWSNAKLVISLTKRFWKGFDQLLAVIMNTNCKNIERNCYTIIPSNEITLQGNGK